jgi:hypothetical protein
MNKYRTFFLLHPTARQLSQGLHRTWSLHPPRISSPFCRYSSAYLISVNSLDLLTSSFQADLAFSENISRRASKLFPRNTKSFFAKIILKFFSSKISWIALNSANDWVRITSTQVSWGLFFEKDGPYDFLSDQLYCQSVFLMPTSYYFRCLLSYFM